MASGAADELRLLSAALHRAGSRDILARLRDELKRAAGPAADAARRSILDMPATHEAGLRRGIADTVKVTAALGEGTARVSVTASGPERWPGAAAKFEGDARRSWWNHPVYGHRDRWVRQVSQDPGWFSDAVSGRQGQFDKAVDRVADGIERELAGE